MGVPMKTGFGVVVLAGGLMLSAAAQQKQLPDAQVESNVLRALASAPELSTQNIQSTTVYGVVTLTGSANDEASRTKAENLVARAEGVKKVVDEMTIGATDAQRRGRLRQTVDSRLSPGTLTVWCCSRMERMLRRVPRDWCASAVGEPAGEQFLSPASTGWAACKWQYPPRRPMYNNAASPPPVYGGQVGGEQVTIPNGAMLRIRINEGLSTHHTTPGSAFDGTVLNDVVADGAVAIPRGATVQGIVVEARDSGTLKGRGELALQLTTLTMGGRTYGWLLILGRAPEQDKDDLLAKNSAIGLGALGALFGAVAGGGTGAAIGAGVGGAAGVASSAASPNGRVVIPPEAVLTFHLAQPTTVATVSEAEMQRLSYAAGLTAAVAMHLLRLTTGLGAVLRPLNGLILRAAGRCWRLSTF